MNFFQRLCNGSNDPFGMNTSPSYQRNHVAANSLKPSYEVDLLGTSPIDFTALHPLPAARRWC
jgi:hypothetical protein